MSNFRGSTYLLAALGAAVWVTSLVWSPPAPPQYRGLETVKGRIPAMAAGFRQERENEFSETVRKALASADLVSYNYVGPSGSADLTLIGGTDRNALHDPRSCMIGAGWRIEDDHEETLPDINLKVRVCRVTGGGSGATDYEVVYLYVVGDRIVNQITEIRTQMLLSAIVGRKGTPVCFVRFMRPMPRSIPDAPQAAQEFRQFVGQSWKEMQIPGSI